MIDTGDLLELIDRRIEAVVGQMALHRYGTVSSVDPTRHLVKVTTQPDGFETGWIHDPAPAVATGMAASPCQVGAQVLLAPMQGDVENVSIVGRVYDDLTPPPTSPHTNAVAQPGEFLWMNGGVYFHIGPGFLAMGNNATSLVLTDGRIAMAVNGKTLTLAGAAIIAGGFGIETNEDVVAGGISLISHVSTQVQPGTGVSGPPQG